MTKKKKTAAKKTVKVSTRYALVYSENFEKDTIIAEQNSYIEGDWKKDPNHAINSFLKYATDEEELKKMLLVKIEVIGKPVVKTTRDIQIVKK